VEERLRAGRISVQRPERRAFVDGVELQLSTSEYDLLLYLVERAGTVVDRDELYVELRGIAYDGLDRSIDLRVSRVRSAIHAVDRSFDPVLTVRGRGYLLRADA
jgi:two-component system, OmpR family, response regulator RstA